MAVSKTAIDNPFYLASRNRSNCRLQRLLLLLRFTNQLGACKEPDEMSAPRLLATIAAHLPRLPVLLFVFVAVHVPASHGDPAPPLTTYDDSMCPESSRCGDVSIKYPFYLSNTIRYIADYSYNTPYACGYTDLEISCRATGRPGRR